MEAFSFRELFLNTWEWIILSLFFSGIIFSLMLAFRHFILKNKIPLWMSKQRWIIGISFGIIVLAICTYFKLNDIASKMLGFFGCMSYVTTFNDK